MKKPSIGNDLTQFLGPFLSEFSPQQMQVADYLIKNLAEIPVLSVPELARKAGVSEATVVRFSQRMGYDGFTDLKMDLMELLRRQIHGQRDGEKTFDASDALDSAARQAVRNIESTCQNLSRDSFSQVSNALIQADHIYAFGLGISTCLAEIFSYMMVQIGFRATVLSPRYSSPLEQMVALRPSDLVVVFSFPPYSRSALEVVENAAGRKIPTLAFCDRESAPVAQAANWVLPVQTENLLFTNNLAPVLMVMYALAGDIVAKKEGKNITAITSINKILRKDPGLIR